MHKLVTGIYSITNIQTNQVYIGSSYKVYERWGYHKKDLRSNKHHSPKLQNSWNKYGESIFKFNIIEICDKEILLKREQYYIDTLNPFFNICKIAGNCSGRKLSKESKDKMSISAKNRPLPKSLIDNQKSKGPADIDNLRYCNYCNKYKDKDVFRRKIKPARKCNECFNKIRPSRKLAKDKLKYKSIYAIKDCILLEFDSLAKAEVYFREIFPKFNRRSIVNNMKKSKSYYGFDWMF